MELLFLHIPKVAGTSIRYALDIKREKCKTLYNNIHFHGHYKIDELVRKKLISKQDMLTWFKFTFVRNPYDRLISYYHRTITNNRSHQYESLDDFFVFLLEAYMCNYTGDDDYKYVANQLDWLTYRGDFCVNFVGRFESLNEDWNKLKLILGTKENLPHLNKSNHKYYREYYNGLTKGLVAKLYERDLDEFKYTF